MFTERFGYKKSIVMTAPTKAVLPYTLEDCIKVMARQKKESQNKHN